MPDKPHVCLIVDNPLRDLEGLVLLGRQLAAKGATVTLVPMYEQGFDVPALRPDLVLVNYTRPNNADLIKSYKRAGILVGVLDTEGIGGKNPDQFAEMVKSVGCTDLVGSLLCLGAGAARSVPASRHGAGGAASCDRMPPIRFLRRAVARCASKTVGRARLRPHQHQLSRRQSAVFQWFIG